MLLDLVEAVGGDLQEVLGLELGGRTDDDPTTATPRRGVGGVDGDEELAFPDHALVGQGGAASVLEAELARPGAATLGHPVRKGREEAEA